MIYSIGRNTIGTNMSQVAVGVPLKQLFKVVKNVKYYELKSILA